MQPNFPPLSERQVPPPIVIQGVLAIEHGLAACHVNLPAATEQPLIVLGNDADDRSGTEGSRQLIQGQLTAVATDLGVTLDNRPSIPFKRQEPGEFPGARYLSDVVAYTELAIPRMKQAVLDAVSNDTKIFAFGGNHVRATELLGFLQACAELGKVPALFWFDAHLDLQNPKTSETGNIHGQPASLLLGDGAQALLDLLGRTPTLQGENMVFLGTNAIDSAEYIALKKHGVVVVSISDLDLNKGMNTWMEAVRSIHQRLGDRMLAFAEVDLDVMAEGAMMTNSWPLSFRELKSAVAFLSRYLGKQLVGLAASELNPRSPAASHAAHQAVDLAMTVKGLPNADIRRHIRAETEQVASPSVVSHAEPAKRIPWWRSAAAVVATSVAGFLFGRAALNEHPAEPDANNSTNAVRQDHPSWAPPDLQQAYTGISRTSAFTPFQIPPGTFLDSENFRSMTEGWRGAEQAKDGTSAGRNLGKMHSYYYSLCIVGENERAQEMLRVFLTGNERFEFLKAHSVIEREFHKELPTITKYLAVWGFVDSNTGRVVTQKV